MTAGQITTVDRAHELYGQGLYLQAYQGLLEGVGHWRDWREPRLRLLGGRLAHNLGSHRLGRVLHRLAYREHPDHPEIRYFFALGYASRRGPWPAWRLMQELGFPATAAVEVQGDWLALQAHLLAMLRDFSAADRLIRQAQEVAGERPWLLVEKALIRELEDRHAEGLEACRRALELQPFFRPAVQMTAHRLVQMNRDEEALALLTAACQRMECGDVVLQLASLRIELRQYEQAREAYAQVERLHPLMSLDRDRQKWLAARRADAAYYDGDRTEAARWARQASGPYYLEFAERLEQPPAEAERVLLGVQFVKQHHVTCAPATLAALSGYWRQPVDHLEVAQHICYDGTPGYSERRWAEERGYYTREFRVTAESARALLDRGVPFTLTTVDPGNAHLQAVIGYDACRQSLLVRDPTERHFAEFQLEHMLKVYASTGPRGMVMVPQAERNRLADIELPEASLYDLSSRIERALEAHRRDEAQELLEQMEQLESGHRLAWRARGGLARYDADSSMVLRSANALLESYPDDVNLVVSKLHALREMGRRKDVIRLLEKLCRSLKCHPMFWIQLARDRLDDARQHPQARRLARAAMRSMPLDGQGYDILAQLAWAEGKRDDALELYRFAACLEPYSEHHSRAYFQAARSAGRVAEALEFLQDRFQRLAAHSGQPARTLCWAYDDLDRQEDAFATLREALALRPTDGELRLFACDLFARFGRHEEAEEQLRRIDGQVKRLDLQRAMALLDLYRGRQEAALEHWRLIQAEDPLSREAQETYARLLADMQGEQAAVRHLTRVVKRFPRSYPLRMLLIEWLRSQPEAAEAELRRLLELHPEDAWARRELSFNLSNQHRWDEALQEGARARELEPGSPVAWYALGHARRMRGQLNEAREDFRESIRQSVDYDFAIQALLECCETKGQREEALEFVLGQLQRQVIQGDGLLTYRFWAERTLPPDLLLDNLRQALDARPDLWHAHTAYALQLVEMERHDEAVEVGRAACARFPLRARVWLDLARTLHALKDYDAEIETLRQALAINPTWGDAIRQLADVYQETDQPQQALQHLRQAIAHDPREERNYAFLGDILWTLGERDEAISNLERAVALEPGFDAAWQRLKGMLEESQRPQRILELAQDLARARPHEARSWIVLAEARQGLGALEEALEALDAAEKIYARSPQVHVARARILSRLKRHDEALRAARPAVFGDAPPADLRIAEAQALVAADKVEQAIECLEQALALDPDDLSAWEELIALREQGNDPQAYEVAGRALVRLAPRHPLSWSYLGDALSRSDRQDEALQCFRRSLETAPDYNYACWRLIDHYIEQKQWDEVEQILAEYGEQLSRERLLVDRTRLALLRGQHDVALDRWRELAEDHQASGEAVDQCGALFLANDRLDGAVAVLEQAVLADDARRQQIGAKWVAWSALAGRLKHCHLAVKNLQDKQLLAECIRQAAKVEDKTTLFENYCEPAAELSKHRATWSAVGDAYAQKGHPGKQLNWMADWETRESLEAGDLLEFAATLLRAERFDEFHRVAQAAAKLPGEPRLSVVRVLAAVACLGRLEIAEAREHLDTCDVERLGPAHFRLYQLAQAGLAAHAALSLPEPARAAYREFKMACREMGDAKHDALFLDARDHLLQGLDRAAGRVWTARWRRWARWLKQRKLKL